MNNIMIEAEDFSLIINNYLLPMIDTVGDLTLKTNPFIENQEQDLVIFTRVNENKSIIKFFPCKKNPPFYCEIKTRCSETIKSNLEKILIILLEASKFQYCSNPIEQKETTEKPIISSNFFQDKIFDIALELGICSRLTNDEAKYTLYSVLQKISTWAAKTYEGEKVPFGIIFNFNEDNSKKAVNFLEFLDNDSSAAFTDGIFSGILLDKNANIIKFITRDTPIEEQNKKSIAQKIFVPYQYTDIAKHCTGTKIGIILTATGEILLIKRKALVFAKRGGKWINFSWDNFYVKLKPYFSNDATQTAIYLDKIKEIYCTILDVSFSHTGGCLAIVSDDKKTNKIKSFVDNNDILINQKNKTPSIKIKIIASLLENSKNNFYDTHRCLKKELLSLDGATIISTNGDIYCAGAIVKVKGGSTGGGRTAAAKQLSSLGVGIKISEDGYIEAFCKDKSNKDMLLFAIK